MKKKEGTNAKSDLKSAISSLGNFEWALEQMKLGYFVKREIVKNDTVIIIYKKRLYQMIVGDGIRFPYVPTNADLMADDWGLVIPESVYNPLYVNNESNDIGNIELDCIYTKLREDYGWSELKVDLNECEETLLNEIVRDTARVVKQLNK